MGRITNFSLVNDLRTMADIRGFLEASFEEAKEDTDTICIKNALQIALKAYKKIEKRNLAFA